ncbi:MAG: 1-acyl-sn-glycerol-3-phosphate acyltransferase, partial [Clostridiales bacterium]|nr:1-acyl-sn-glycerol-3-phosphate acyltransferase [Clostridiales bacterium]
MKKEPVRFDMSRPPVRTKWYLKPITYLISKPVLMSHRQKLVKTGMDGIKPPYLLLCNHNAFMDIMAAAAAVYPDRANYVVAIDGFIGREKLLRDVGCICKRKFTSDLILIRQLKRVIANGDIAVVYPEARYSLCGTTAVLPESLGRLCKLLKVPVVTLICHGHHINSPFWNLHQRKVKPIEAEMTLQMTAEEAADLDADEINRRLVSVFQYDEYAWQLERGIRVKYKGRAEGLEKILYQCPSCGAEFKMKTSGTELRCSACGKKWTMTELGQLESEDGEPIFT